MEIIVLGSGCEKCVELEAICIQITKELGMDASLRKITEMGEIIRHGVWITPGLMINGKLMSSGKVPPRETIESWIKNAG